MTVVPQPQRNRQRDTQSNHRDGKPAEQRPDRGKERQREHEQHVAAVPAGHERRDRTAHRRRRNDERRRENQPCERRIAAHVRGQPLDGARTRFPQLLLIVGESGNDERGARGLVEEHVWPASRAVHLVVRFGVKAVMAASPVRSSRAIRLHARSTRSPSGVG